MDIQCPRCGTVTSDQSLACPRCGNPTPRGLAMRKEKQFSSQANHVTERGGKDHRFNPFIISTIILSISVIVLLSLLYMQSSKYKSIVNSMSDADIQNNSDTAETANPKEQHTNNKYIEWVYDPDRYPNIYDFILKKIDDLSIVSNKMKKYSEDNQFKFISVDDMYSDKAYRNFIYNANNWAYGVKSFDYSFVEDQKAVECFEIMKEIADDIGMIEQEYPLWMTDPESASIGIEEWSIRVADNITKVGLIANRAKEL